MQESCLSPEGTSFEILLNRFRPLIYAFFHENAIRKYKKNKEFHFFVCLAQFYSLFFVIITEEKKSHCLIRKSLEREKGMLHKRKRKMRVTDMHFHKYMPKQAEA